MSDAETELNLLKMRQALDEAWYSVAKDEAPPAAEPRSPEAVEQEAAELAKLLEEGRIHYLSFFSVPADEECPGYVVLEIYADSSVAAMRTELANRTPHFLRSLFGRCDGYPSDGDNNPAPIRRFISRNTHKPDALFVAFPGRTVKQLREERDLRLQVRAAAQTPSAQPPAGGSFSPTSASAEWESLQNRFRNGKQKEFVKHGSTRPWFVRWGLNGGGWKLRLDFWARRAFPLVLAVMGFFGIARVVHDRKWSYNACGFAGALFLLITIATWLREASPRGLRFRGALRVFLSGIASVFLETAVAAAALGAFALGIYAANQLTVFIGFVSVLAFLGLGFVLWKIGLPQVALCLGGLLVLAPEVAPKYQTPLHEWLPWVPTDLSKWLPWISAAFVAALGLGAVLVVGVLLYVMYGRVVGWLGWPIYLLLWLVQAALVAESLGHGLPNAPNARTTGDVNLTMVVAAGCVALVLLLYVILGRRSTRHWKYFYWALWAVQVASVASSFVPLPLPIPAMTLVVWLSPVCIALGGVYYALAQGGTTAARGGVFAAFAGGVSWLSWMVAEYHHERGALCTPRTSFSLSLVLLVVVAALAGGVAMWLFAVRQLEADDLPGDLSWKVDHLDKVEDREDRTFQNHLPTVSRIKTGALRLLTLKRVLRAVQFLAREYFTQGDLGGIHTIHFAQFIVLPDNERLLFMGNYDGAFSSYLQDFNSVMGVPAVWSNCVDFPHTYYLIGDGSSDEQRFKAFGRRTQVETLGWYSAYPALSVKDIGTGTLIRELLRRPIEDSSTLLRRLRSRFADSATEADCDAALRLV